MITKPIIEQYFAKANKVVDSCKNLDQLEGARNYANNFFTLIGEIEHISPKVVTAPELVIKYYNKLISKIEKIEKSHAI